MPGRIVYFSPGFRGVIVALACLLTIYGLRVAGPAKLDVFPALNLLVLPTLALRFGEFVKKTNLEETAAEMEGAWSWRMVKETQT